MKVVTDGKQKWVGSGKVNTDKGLVDTGKPPEWAEVFDASFNDKLSKMGRGPQTIHPADVGTIITLAGLGRGSRVVEGGAGSGYLTAWLAHIGCEVHSYEKHESHFNLVRKNMEMFGLDVDLKKGSVFEMQEEELDAVIFDVPDPWEGADRALKALKQGGFLISYVPTANQAMRWLSASRKFSEHRIVTSGEVDWRVDRNRFRPRSKTLAHTAFICAARKL